MKVYAIILAAGKGIRFNGKINDPKQFLKLSGKTIIEHTVSVFQTHPKINEIIIVTLKDYVSLLEELTIKKIWSKVSKILIGGNTRQESSYVGINSIVDDDNSLVLIHDAVRPLLSHIIINKVIDALKKHDAVDVAVPSTDTIVKIDNNSFKIIEIPDRKNYWRGQTPQGFKLGLIKRAHNLAKKDGFTHVTDDCGLIIHYNLSDVYVVKGEEENIKITYPIDFYLADKLFQLKTIKQISTSMKNLKDKVIVVFGASRGIGKAIVEESSRAGARAYGFSRSNGFDIRNRDNIKKALESVYLNEKKIDHVIVTAAILRRKPLIFSDYDEIINQINTNYIGSINVAIESYPYLKKSKGSLVYFTSSSYTRGRAFYSIYSSTKAAIVNLTQALSEEWFEDGIRVNAICPERTATPMRFENFGKEPLDSLLDPHDVAKKTLRVLISDFTGQIVEVKK